MNKKLVVVAIAAVLIVGGVLVFAFRPFGRWEGHRPFGGPMGYNGPMDNNVFLSGVKTALGLPSDATEQEIKEALGLPEDATLEEMREASRQKLWTPREE